MKRKWMLVLSILFISGCQTTSSNEQRANRLDPKQRSTFEDGLKAFDQKNYPLAIAKFDEHLGKYPNSPYYSAALYNLGLSYEAVNRYDEALERYKKVVSLAQGQKSKNEAEALYRISICYEALGNDAQTLFTLMELEKHQGYLSREVLEVEVPARIATSYARQSNLESAIQYYEKASAGLKKLRRQVLTGDLPIWLPKTLYHMGRVTLGQVPITPENYKTYVLPLDRAQVWLIRGAETGTNEWAQKSKDELIGAYQLFMDAIDKVPLEDSQDKIGALKKQQEFQRAMSVDFLSSWEHLKLERIPRTDPKSESPFVGEIFAKIEGLAKKADGYLRSKDVNDRLTPEAEKREGIKREGRIIEGKP